MKVLFVCIANTNRSQIAEAVFNKLSKKNEAQSAGIRPKNPGIYLKDEDHNPVVPMKDFGYDISKAKIKRLNPRLADWADKVVFVFYRKKHEKEIPTYLKKFKNKEFWDVGSISNETTFEEYRTLEKKRIKKIERLVKDLVKRIG